MHAENRRRYHVCDLRWLWLTLRSTSAVEAENLFLRRQLALYVERGVKPRRIDLITRIALMILSGFFGGMPWLWSVRALDLERAFEGSRTGAAYNAASQATRSYGEGTQH
jgi:hypothetical protein